MSGRGTDRSSSRASVSVMPIVRPGAARIRMGSARLSLWLMRQGRRVAVSSGLRNRLPWWLVFKKVLPTDAGRPSMGCMGGLTDRRPAQHNTINWVIMRTDGGTPAV